MPRVTRRNFLASASAAAAAQPAPLSPLTLWYRQPAKTWTEALPVGNGRLGAMVFGGVETERIQLNEDTLWSGAPKDWNNPQAKAVLPEVRRLVMEEKYEEADKLCTSMQGPYNQSYLPLADLHLQFSGLGPPENYRRELNLDTAIASTVFASGGATFRREVFASFPDQLVVVRLTASGNAKLNFTVTLTSPLRFEVAAAGTNGLSLTGKAPAHVDPNYHRTANPVIYDEAEGKGMRFACCLAAQNDGGRVSVAGKELRVENARAVTLYVSAATGFNGFDKAPDAAALPRALERLGQRKAYNQLRAAHTRDHQRLFRRVALNIGNPALAALPTGERLEAFKKDPSDDGLLALYFQYGRYLLIASSRPGTQPANLQGIWNESIRPPWSSNWTTNINVQMNYWHAETTNLAECHEPLFDLTDGLAANGAATARVNYGARGWCCHHNADIWRQTAPVGNFGGGSPTWANWQMSGPWFCQHLWERFLFTRDTAFLKQRAYPIMKGAAEFCLDMLIDAGQGTLTTAPSFSTENTFLTESGRKAQTSAGCTMDIALIRELFSNCIAAAELLNLDAAFRATLAASLAKLIPYQTGKHGQLMEWSKDFDEAEPGQRHMSHMYPLYPGHEFTPRRNARFWKASRVSLERRLKAGGAYTGWSRAWAICFWARLEDGEMAYESLCRLLDHSTGPNLFDTHPAGSGWIFQIDGNFGGAAAVAEMLLQSHEEELRFLPALPKAWNQGSVKGLCARNGIVVDLAWTAGKVSGYTLLSLTDQTVRIAGAGPVRLRAGVPYKG
ncbi:MAG: glycoside hydrolase family 95 protein [Bryobacterales bacterium]|nr:glycoside hydrolase family 95 protein [Bryobacterales bacterium]